MSHIVNSCPQSKAEGAAAIALSRGRCYRMAEDIMARKCTRQRRQQQQQCQTSTRDTRRRGILLLTAVRLAVNRSLTIRSTRDRPATFDIM